MLQSITVLNDHCFVTGPGYPDTSQPHLLFRARTTSAAWCAIALDTLRSNGCALNGSCIWTSTQAFHNKGYCWEARMICHADGIGEFRCRMMDGWSVVPVSRHQWLLKLSGFPFAFWGKGGTHREHELSDVSVKLTVGFGLFCLWKMTSKKKCTKLINNI